MRRLFAVVLMLAGTAPAHAAGPVPDLGALVGDRLVGELRAIVANEVVGLSVKAQNRRFAGLGEPGILKLDDQWKAEREAADKPLIAATLSSPLSTYLIRTQARSLGLYAEIFVMDRNGLNVGQSSVTSDFWQGDEAKFQKSFGAGPDTVFVDEPEWDDELGIWRAQVSLTVADEAGAPIGAATFELNLTELQRRQALGS
jgi:hypothetical protein